MPDFNTTIDHLPVRVVYSTESHEEQASISVVYVDEIWIDCVGADRRSYNITDIIDDSWFGWLEDRIFESINNN